jgi:hypothetical protein
MKQALWNILDKQSYLRLFTFKAADQYVLSSVTIHSDLVEYYDTQVKLGQLNQIHYFFRLYEVDSLSLEEKVLNADLSKAVGFNLNEVALIKDLEILSFRVELFNIILDRINQVHQFGIWMRFKVESGVLRLNYLYKCV